MKTITQIQTEKTHFVIVGKSTSDSDTLAFHPVDDSGQVMAEQPFSKKSAKAIFNVFKAYDFKPLYFEDFIDNTILKAKSTADKTELVFYVPSQKTQLYFDSEVNLPSKRYLIPTLVFKYKNGAISVVATPDQKPNPNSLLFHAPFFNVFSDHKICMGDVNLKVIDNIETFESLKTFISNAFFNSIFTHSNNALISEQYLIEKAKLKTWCAKDLHPIKKTKKEQLTLNNF